LQDETLQLSVTDSHLDAEQRMWPVGLTRTGPETSLDSLPQLKTSDYHLITKYQSKRL